MCLAADVALDCAAEFMPPQLAVYTVYEVKTSRYDC